MKALDECMLKTMFMLLLRVRFLVTKPKGVTTQMKAFDECVLKTIINVYVITE